MNRVLLGAAAAATAAAVAAALAALVPLSAHRARSGSSLSRPAPSAGDDRYARAIDTAHALGLRVWVETDLVKRWSQGRGPFRTAVSRVAVLADRPGVVGIKIADEMGYHDGLRTAGQIQSFLTDSAAALRAAAPGRLILVDMVVPELGCLPDRLPPPRPATICAARQRGRYPQLAPDKVDGYLASGTVDVLDLSTGLQTDATYAGWGVDTDQAQRAAWRAVRERGWDRLVQLQARKALAHPGAYRGGADAAAAAVRTYIDIPVALGAAAVDVWTWRQVYQGQVYRLADPGGIANPLWNELASRRAAGVHLFTHFSPSSTEKGVPADLAMIAGVCTDLFVAAGTG